MGIALEPLGDPKGIDWGAFIGWKPLDPRPNMPTC